MREAIEQAPVTGSFRLDLSQQMWTPAHRYASIQVLADGHGTSGWRVPKACLVELQISVLQNDGIVEGDRRLGLHREHPVEILAPAFAKRRALFRRRLGELTVELGDVVLAQKGLGLLE